MQEKVKSKVSGLAIAGLFCAIIGAVLFGVIVAVIGLILGLIALIKINRSKGEIKGKGIATAAVIVAIAGTILRILIFIPPFVSTKETAKKSATLAQIAGIKTALEMYKVDNGNYPQQLSVLVVDSSGKGAYLKNLPKDAWGRDYVYRVKSSDNFELFSLGPDGVEGSKDDIKLNDL